MTQDISPPHTDSYTLADGTTIEPGDAIRFEYLPTLKSWLGDEIPDQEAEGTVKHILTGGLSEPIFFVHAPAADHNYPVGPDDILEVDP